MYKKYIEDNPILVEDYVGKDGVRVLREKKRALTMEGFECFVMDNTEITYPDLTNYFDGKLESFKDFVPICSRIKREIRANQIDLGLAGVINPSITQRLNNLTERVDSTTNGKEISDKKTLSITLPDGTKIDDFNID